LETFASITDDQDFSNFPNVREFKDDASRTKKTIDKINFGAVKEIANYFYTEQEAFFLFLKSLTSQTSQNLVINRVSLDDFISKVNTLLLKDSRIKIEDYETIQKWIPNIDEREIFLNIDVPEYIQDYFVESLNCSAYGLFRSSILFCTFALEASLRHKYAELMDEDEAYSNALTFNKAIKWGIENNLIEQNEFNRVSIDFIREYRNDLAHCNMNKPNAKLKISSIYAKKMSSIVIHLIELFINSIYK